MRRGPQTPLLEKLRRKTLFRLTGSIAAVIVLIIVSLSVFLYVGFERRGLELAFKNNQSIVSQLSYNIDYMNESIKNSMVVQFVDPNNQMLMYSGATNNFDKQWAVNLFAKSIASNAMIAEAALYNPRLRECYTSRTGIMSDSEIDFCTVVSGANPIPALTPIPRLRPDAGGSKDSEVFTYAIYDRSSLGNEQVSGALVVDVNIDWLRTNLTKSSEGIARYYILKGDYEVILDSMQQLKMFTPLAQPYVSEIRKEPSQGKSFRNEGDIVTYLPIQHTNWILVTEEPYGKMFEQLRLVRDQTLWLTLLFVLGGVGVALFMARHIYAPFGNLVRQVRTSLLDRFPELTYKNESEYVAKALDLGFHVLGEHEKFKLSTQDLIADKRLKAFLLKEERSAPQDDEAYELDSWLRMPAECRYVLAVFRVDQKRFAEQAPAAERQLFYFSFANVADDIFSGDESCTFRKTSLGGGTFAYILRREHGADAADETAWNDAVREQIRRIQALIARITPGYSVTAAVCSPASDSSKLPELYESALSWFDYRIFYGDSVVLEEAHAQVRSAAPRTELSAVKTERLCQQVKSGQVDDAMSLFDDILRDISKADSGHLFASLFLLVFELGKVVQEMNQNRLHPIEFQATAFCSKVMEQGTLAELRTIFRELFGTIIDQLKQETATKHNYLVQAVLDYFMQEYERPDLGLKEIAAEFKMSGGYIGQIFRDSTQQSIADYIHRLRMQKVTEQLCGTELSVRDIMYKTGYTNEANFYKLFKRHFGITPNEYRQNFLYQSKGDKRSL